jgi:hypothetical protein
MTVRDTPDLLAPLGIFGATQPSRYLGATASGPPTVGSFAVGDFAVDQSGAIWICITAGIGTAAVWTNKTSTEQKWGLMWTFDPIYVNTISMQVANRGWYCRVKGSGTISKIGIVVSTQAGNICVATYTNTGTGRAAKAATRTQTSGSVACPAAGYQEIALGGSVFVNEGDWFYVGSDSASTILRGSGSAAGNAQHQGRGDFEANAFPAPATATPAGGGIDRIFLLCGVA